MLQNMPFYDGSNLLMVRTDIPAKGEHVSTTEESCEGNGVVDKARQYLSFINIQDGLPPRTPIIDTGEGAGGSHGGNGMAGTSGANAILIDGLARFEIPPGPITAIRKNRSIHLRMRNEEGQWEEEKMQPMPEFSVRPSWWLLR